MSKKKSLRLTFLLLGSAILSTGFADCNFSAITMEYKLSECPKGRLTLPQTVKNENLEATKEIVAADQDAKRPYECKKLIRYHVKKKMNPTWANKEGIGTLDLYVGFTKADSCTAIASWPGSGPPIAESQKEDIKKRWNADFVILLQMLLKDSSLVATESPIKSSIETNKEQYKKWCDDLPLLPAE